jgi:hypothetical protein
MSSRRDLTGALSALIRLIDISDGLDAVRNGSVLAHAREIAHRAERGLIEQVPWTPFEERLPSPPTAAQIKALMRQHRYTEAEVLALYATEVTGKLWVNSRYQVLVRETGGTAVHLSIKRLDQSPIRDWRDLQRCKDELVGGECEAIELYPAHSRLVDTTNQYHLWAISDPTFRFPIGFETGGVSDSGDANEVGAGQRPLS